MEAKDTQSIDMKLQPVTFNTSLGIATDGLHECLKKTLEKSNHSFCHNVSSASNNAFYLYGRHLANIIEFEELGRWFAHPAKDTKYLLEWICNSKVHVFVRIVEHVALVITSDAVHHNELLA